MSLYNNYKMKEHILKSYLYDRSIKLNELQEYLNPLMLILAEDLENKKTIKDALIEIIDSIRFEDITTEHSIMETKQNIEYFEGAKEIFSAEELKSISDIKERLNWKIEHIESLKEDRKEFLKRNLNKIKKEFEKYKEFDEFNEKNYNKLHKLLIEDDIYFFRYLNLYNDYMYEIEENLAKIIFSKWDKEMTKLDQYKDGEPFRFLVHAIGCNAERAQMKTKSCNIIATSIITDKRHSLYANREYGFIYYPTKDNVILINSGDCYADELTLSDTYPGISVQYVSANTYLNHTSVNTSRNYLIEQLESKMEGEKNNYNEIVLYNNEGTNPIGVFVKKNASETYKEDAKQLSDEMKLRLIEID
ncbi:hypothetical protein [Clostridium estertheticum]|uniref:hypothetical protein n=1 Tax=Clostridium estertheticum TaxID=238834 RepID=UPI001C0BD504|nr:hypothetical protein [Clostridium estertheticum]MBU3075698.1 hypothetical protein [Clostridium estertheticum]MBU3165810.1 hypothetical protein [Clostridium estertheticum]